MRIVTTLSFFVIFLIVLSCHHAINLSNIYVTDLWGKEYHLVNSPQKWMFNCSFPEVYKDDVRFGFQMWQTFTNKPLFEELSTCVPNSKIYDRFFFEFYIVSYENKFSVDDDGKENKAILGSTTRITGSTNEVENAIFGGHIVFYKSWMALHPWGRRNTAVHEAGHTLGFNHTTKTCIMHPSIAMVFFNDKQKKLCYFEIEELRRMYTDVQSR